MKKILLFLLFAIPNVVFSQYPGYTDQTRFDNLIYFNSFDSLGDNTRLISLNGTTGTYTVGNGYMDITGINSSTNAVPSFGPRLTGLLDSSYYEITIELAILSGNPRISTGYGSNDQDLPLISSRIKVRLWKGLSYPLPNLDAVCIKATSVSAVRIFEIRIEKGPNIEQNLFQRGAVRLGTNASTTSLTTNEVAIGPNAVTTAVNQIAIGTNATIGGVRTIKIGTGTASGANEIVGIGNAQNITLQAVVIGDSASATLNSAMGAPGGPDVTAIGETAYAGAWRATAIGGHAIAGMVSSTAIGTGAVTYASHGIALGRGSYIPFVASSTIFSNTIMAENDKVYLNNGGWHRADPPPNGISMSVTKVPSSLINRYCGPDAFDARATPADFNISAGHTAIVAGLATGSGESGEVQFRIGTGNNGPNVKDTELVAAVVRSEQSITPGKTHLWLYDPATATLKQVLKADKPAAAGTNGIRGVARLSL